MEPISIIPQYISNTAASQSSSAIFFLNEFAMGVIWAWGPQQARRTAAARRRHTVLQE